jgi:hypothetical protein
MKTRLAALMLAASLIAADAAFAQSTAKEESWHIKASYIEACSCALFCPCYFNTAPDKDFCKFNNAIKIKEGHYGKVKLDGMKVWMSGDLGGDFTKGMKSSYYTFEPSATQEQVDAALKVFAHVYPAKFSESGVDRAPIVWEKKGDTAHAKLGDGQGEVHLAIVKGNDNKSPVVIKNLAYWGAQKNDGFVLAKSKHHYKGHGLDYAFNDANGFLIEIESSGGPKPKGE